jgi:hypothetical protein
VPSQKRSELLKENIINKKMLYKKYTIKQKQAFLLEAENAGNSISLTERKYSISLSW